MNKPTQILAAISLTLLLALPLGVNATELGKYYQVSYQGSQQAGELTLGVTHTLWVPQGVKTLRGIVVHQHGCGTGACQGGATAAYDWHWQTLAAKWDCALLGPSYQQAESDDCRLWSNPRQGSDKVFFQALADLANRSGHPELTEVPWCLWGHSGGGYWASEMLSLHPERIVAVWLRSGASGLLRQNPESPEAEPPPAAFQVPVMCNPGAKEENDPRFGRIWTGMLEMFKAFRIKAAPIGFAPDPRTGHECGDSRSLAIPFFDACLAMRLPARPGLGQTLRPVDMSSAWFGPLLGHQPEPAASYKGSMEDAVWLPNESVAKAWAEYVRTGAVNDTTPPPGPFMLTTEAKTNGAVELTWGTQPDFESGLAGFIIRRDAKELSRLPAQPVGRFGRSLFQKMSYHDTPEKPLPKMRFVDTNVIQGVRHEYTVSSVNGVGLESGDACADVLIVADEFPAMELLAKRLKVEENQTTRIVDQGHMPADLALFKSVVVYIHKGLAESAERAFIEYAERGGRLVVLHHSISSGKRQNRHWFSFLGVELPPGNVDQGGYKWTEGVTVQWFNLAGDHFVMTNRVEYPAPAPSTRSPETLESLPAFTLHETEVYLNHVHKGPRTLLMGLRYTDQATGKTWIQKTAGWHRPTGRGCVFYFMPGHTLHDFEDAIYGRIVLNAITAEPAFLK